MGHAPNRKVEGQRFRRGIVRRFFLPPSNPEELIPRVLFSSDFPIDHAVSEIHNFVKVLPEGVTLDVFMRSQPPLLGGTVGNLAEVPHCYSILAHLLGFAPPLEKRRFVCEHCESDMTKEYLVWHMNAKYVVPTLYYRGVRIGVDVGLDIKKSRTRAMC